MPTDWASALDDFGRALLDFEHRLEQDPAAAREFAYQLPPDLGPLPEDLVATAIGVAELTARVEARLQEAMVATAHERASVTRARGAMHKDRRRARFIDVQT